LVQSQENMKFGFYKETARGGSRYLLVSFINKTDIEKEYRYTRNLLLYFLDIWYNSPFIL